jgi:hypothetical protein
MNLKEWRALQRQDVTLPSGLEVTLRRITLVDLAAQGSIPAPLIASVNQVISSQTFSVATVEDYQKYGAVVDLLVKASIVNPPLAEHGDDRVADDEHLGLDELSLDDKLFIFNIPHKPSEEIAPFRPQPERVVDAGPDGGAIRDEAERDPEPAG